MTVAAGIDKQTIVHLLDMRPQQSLHVLLRVLGYLLKLIDGENAWFVSLFQITEYLLQRQLRCVDVTQFDIECRQAARRVVSDTACQGVKSCQELINHRLPFGHQYGVYLLAKKQYQFVQAGSRIYIRIKGIVVVLDGWLLIHMAD